MAGDRWEACEDPDAQAAADAAEELLAAERGAAAIPLLRSAVAACPERVALHGAYQDAAFALGDPAQAEMLAYYEGMEDDGRSPLVPYLRARIARLQRREHPCQECLAEALRRDPDFYYAHYESGLMWRGVDRPKNAAVELRRALAARPSLLPARLALAEVAVELELAEEAARSYRTYLETRPDDRKAAIAFVNLLVYKMDGDEIEAARVVEHLLAETPEDLDLQMTRAATQWKRGEIEAAIASYRQVLASDPGRSRAALNLGNLHYDRGLRASGTSRQEAWEQAGRAYVYYRQLGVAADGYDWWDLNFGVPARMAKMAAVVGPLAPGRVGPADF